MKKLFLIIWGALFILDVFPRSVQITSNVLTENDGLPNNSVCNIHKDKAGFIWFATDVGISRYDGYHFVNYRLKETPFAVRRIFEIEDNLLCLLGVDGSALCFDSGLEKVLPVEFDSDSLRNVVFTDLCYIGNGYLCGLYKQNLLCWSVSRQDGKVLLLSSLKQKKWRGNKWTQICKDDKNHFYAFSEEARLVYCYNFDTQASFVYDISELFDCYDVSNIARIFVHDDCVWLQKRWQGVICYNLKNKTHRQIDLPEVNFDVRWVVSLGLNNYALVTWNGLFRISFEHTPTQGNYELIHFSDKSVAKIRNACISATFDEKENVLWVATFGGGAVKYMMDNVFFKWIDLPPNIEVNKVVEDDNGYIWLSSVDKGLLKSKKNVICEGMEFEVWNNSEPLSGKCGMYKDRNGCIWIGDEYANFLCIDPMTDQYAKYKIRLENKSDFSVRIQDFCLDTKGNLWIGTDKGLVRFKRKENTFELIKDGKIKNKAIRILKEDGEGDLWIGTYEGLVRMIQAKDSLKFVDGYEAMVGAEASIVYSIFINSNNRTMVGYADKLLFIDNNHKECVERTFSLGKNLPCGHIYCIAEDREGNLWFGDNSGIMTMKVGTGLIYTYSSLGNNMDVCTLKDGRLFWLSLDKLLYYDPVQVKKSVEVHPFALSRLVIDNEVIRVGKEYNGQVILSQSVNQLKELTLGYANRNFTLYMTDLHYKMIGQKIFYRLLPDDPEWKSLDVREGLTFTNLGKGLHTLQVQAVAYDGDKGEIEEFAIHILPHWSVTWWAWLTYFLIGMALVSLLIGYLHYRMKRYKQRYLVEEKLKNALYRIELKQQQEREAVKIKNKFYGLLTNELRSPLTMIINPLREVLKTDVLSDVLKKDIEMAYYNSVGLQDICTQLTNMYRMETDYEFLQVAKYDVSDVLDNIIKKQSENLNVYHIDLRYNLPEKGSMEVWIDRDLLEFVICILLSNAYRHVVYMGQVEMCVSKEIRGEEEYCVISVRDNGREKVEENIENFFRQDNFNENVIDLSRMELGYELLEKIIARHQGEIKFTSKEREGTLIFVKLRCGVQHFSNDSKVIFIQSVTENTSIHDALSLPQMNLWNWDEEESSSLAEEDDKKKLLIVDDSQAFRLYMKIAFANKYQVLEAQNGQEGIDKALEEMPDVILCDVMMPVKSGFDCCRELKGNLRTCHIPIIFLTARNMEEDIMSGMETGADDYLQKPINIDVLKAKVAAMIKNREQLKQTYMGQLMQVRTFTDGGKENLPIIEDAFIKRVVDLVEEHMEEVDFSVTTLAKLMNMSQPTLYRKVKQSSGLNIAELIRGVRLRKAAELLEQEDYTIQEVIEKVGYNDQASFRRHFMKLFNTTPSAYIKQHKL